MRPEPNELDIGKAWAWANEHAVHVGKLMASTSVSYAPSGSDCSHPELWKPGHWNWLHSLEAVT